MKKNLGKILYILTHAAVFATMFLVPVCIPDHRSGSGDFYMRLVFLLYPAVTAVTAGISAAVAGIPWPVRLISAIMPVPIGIPLLYFPFGGLAAALRISAAYAALYATCFFAVRGLIRIVRSVCTDYRGYLARHRGE